MKKSARFIIIISTNGLRRVGVFAQTAAQGVTMSETGNILRQTRHTSPLGTGGLPRVGLLPNGSRLPHARASAFTGRIAELKELAGALFQGSSTKSLSAETRQVILSGPPGIGKTALAVEFCHRFGRFFDGVHWLCAGPYNDLDAELAQCGALMPLPAWPDSVAGQVEAVQWAWQSTRRLVVLDGLQDPQRLADWPLALQNCWLVTTADFDVSAQAAPGAFILPVGPLEQAECQTALRKLAPRLKHALPEETARLVESLAQFPLSLLLAGQNLGERAWTKVNDYHADLTRRIAVLPDEVRQWAADSPQRLALAAAFQITFQQLRGPAEHERFTRLAFLTASACAPGAPIPADLIDRALTLAGGQGLLLKGISERLVNLGLFMEGEQEIVVHPVLSDLAGLFTHQFTEVIEPLSAALREISLADSPDGPPAPFLPFRAHLQAAASRAEALRSPAAGDLWKSYGQHLSAVKEYSAARRAHERALAAHQTIFGPNHPSIAEDSLSLGQVLREQGDLLAARASFEHALAVEKLNPQPDLAALAALLGDLGKARFDLEDYPGALECFQNVQHILEQNPSNEHPALIANLRRLGETFFALKRFSEAQACFARAIAIHSRAQDDGRPDPAADFYHLGRAYAELGEADEARAAYVNALQALQKELPAGSPALLSLADSLGQALLDLQEPALAAALYEGILPLVERAAGPQSAETAVLLLNLGRAWRHQTDLAKAREHIERAIQIDTKIFGPHSLPVARDLNQLGRVHRLANQLIEAKDCFLKVLEIDRRHSGPEHVNVAADLNNLGLVYQEMDDLTNARSYFEQALAIDEKNFGADHLVVGRDSNYLGAVLQALGDLRGARIAYERALRVSKKRLPANHPDIAINANNLGRILYAFSDLPAAKECFEQALAIDKQNQDGENLAAASDMHNLGRVLVDLQDLPAAKSHFETALRIRKNVYPADHPKVLSVVNSLDNLITLMRNPQANKKG